MQVTEAAVALCYTKACSRVLARMTNMKRRDLLTFLGGAAALLPRAAGAQQAAMPVVGYLGIGSPEQTAHVVAGFRKGLSETGFVEGRNVAIEYRWAHDGYDRLPDLAADLVRSRVAVIATLFGTPASLAAKAATATIPVVFYVGADPVQLGLVMSLNRPSGNVTGVTSMNRDLGAKRLGILHELLPRAVRFAVLVNPTNPSSELQIKDAQAAASAIGLQIEIVAASTNRDIDAVFAIITQKRADALLVSTDNLFNNRRVQLATLAARHALPMMSPYRELTEVGGLMSYGSNIADQARLAGVYTGRILKGEKPADLPVMRAVKFDFLINLQTARTLGIEVPPTLLALADEVIE
jgi:putative ABC transport system substrate-binding protein